MLIGKDYKLESDDMNVTLYLRHEITGTGRNRRKTTKAVGEEYWTPIAYFSTPKNALEYLVEREVKLTGLKDWQMVLKRIDELEAMIKALPIGNKV